MKVEYHVNTIDPERTLVLVVPPDSDPCLEIRDQFGGTAAAVLFDTTPMAELIEILEAFLRSEGVIPASQMGPTRMRRA